MMNAQSEGGGADLFGKQAYVFSRTLRPSDYPEVTIVSDAVEETVTSLRKEPGKDIWLFGGGRLFRSLLEAGQVDGHRVYDKSGIVSLDYTVKT